jgi:hypothetical protein
MKKSNFIALIFGTISLMFFALGMCMTILPEWNTFNQGIILGCIGLVSALINLIIWRRVEHKPSIVITGKTIITVMVGIIGSLALGIGMSFTMVWANLFVGVVIGFAGILILLSLIPIIKGLK